jgi:monoamine oxidase
VKTITVLEAWTPEEWEQIQDAREAQDAQFREDLFQLIRRHGRTCQVGEEWSRTYTHVTGALKVSWKGAEYARVTKDLKFPDREDA